MKLSRRSYPHPVLGNRDDVPGAAFQPTIEVSADKQFVYIDIRIQCSSGTILDLVKAGRAAYVAHVECTNTVFRRAYEFREEREKITIPTDQLNETVELNVFAVSKETIRGYAIEAAHEDYKGAAFIIRRADILAIGETRTFLVEPQESLGRIGTIMQIDCSIEDGDQPMKLDLQQQKIRVVLSKPDFEQYKILRNNEALLEIVTMAIVLPALIAALSEIRSGSGDEFEGLRWYEVLIARMDSLGLSKDSDPITAVQRLLDLPIRRTLTSAHRFAEAAS